MDLAFAEIYGVADAFARVEFSGRTDYAIFFDALDYSGLAKQNYGVQLDRFRTIYLERLATVLPERDGHILPGVAELVRKLADKGAAQGVATGNFEGGALLKLQHFGLQRWLRGGGFGDETAVRAEVVAAGARSIGKAHGVTGDSRVFVIGDTPLDVEAARANGFTSIAVATGHNGVDVLQACGADHVFEDLSDVGPVLEILRSS